ncbi:phytochrome sensor protein [Burkholderia ubonensis]|uniref:fimbrial biogenesis chaperone n=1 Tax=Burkholderia ubonensis TaxID=101571 RepID=UPI00075E2C67|nr:molecular chaperone [Burkholderia ubonensis]KVC54277.1 phytochrome sensor protein [Burkholderia ubonensis]KVD88366.1 phytochrome sensor protein [Burkholderia ubonensis]
MKPIMCQLAKWITAAALAAACVDSHATNFTVSPVRVELSAAHTSVALTVRNESADEPVIVQLRTAAWSQNAGDDVYASTGDLIAAPPIFTIPPGGSQVVRVGLRHAPSADQETGYRLYLREVPPTPKPGFAGVQIALEMSLPIFVRPKNDTAPRLRWAADPRPNGAGMLALRVTNEGTAHAQVANLELLTPGSDRPVATHAEFAYILPGQSRQLVFRSGSGAAPAVASGLRLVGYSDAGNIDSTIAPSDR